MFLSLGTTAYRLIIAKDGQRGDAGIFAGKTLRGVLCGRTVVAADNKNGMKARNKLLDKVAEHKWSVYLPGGSGLTSQESCWIKSSASRSSLLPNPSAPSLLRGPALGGRQSYIRRRNQVAASHASRSFSTPAATYPCCCWVPT
jgi:hypothetical protein